MLSQQRIEELRAVVKAAYPAFGTHECKNSGKPNPYNTYFNPYRCSVGEFPIQIALPNLTGAVNCCGMKQFKDLIGEMTGLYTLSAFNEVEKAIFALWLNDNPQSRHTLILASTGSPNKKAFKDNQSEQVLLFAGFKPLARGLNMNHGPNHVTLWALQLNEDTIPANAPRITPPDLTPPEVAVAAVEKPKKKPVRKKKIPLENSWAHQALPRGHPDK